MYWAQEVQKKGARFLSAPVSFSILLCLSVSVSVCLSISVSVSLCPCHAHLFHSFCVKILELLFSGETSLEGKNDGGWRITQHDAVETDLTLQAGSLAFLLSLPLTSCELPGKSFPWVSMDSGKRLSLVLWIVSKSWWMLFFFLMNAFLSSLAIVILGTKLSL